MNSKHLQNFTKQMTAALFKGVTSLNVDTGRSMRVFIVSVSQRIIHIDMTESVLNDI